MPATLREAQAARRGIKWAEAVQLNVTTLALRRKTAAPLDVGVIETAAFELDAPAPKDVARCGPPLTYDGGLAGAGVRI